MKFLRIIFEFVAPIMILVCVFLYVLRWGEYYLSSSSVARLLTDLMPNTYAIVTNLNVVTYELSEDLPILFWIVSPFYLPIVYTFILPTWWIGTFIANFFTIITNLGDYLTRLPFEYGHPSTPFDDITYDIRSITPIVLD